MAKSNDDSDSTLTNQKQSGATKQDSVNDNSVSSGTKSTKLERNPLEDLYSTKPWGQTAVRQDTPWLFNDSSPPPPPTVVSKQQQICNNNLSRGVGGSQVVSATAIGWQQQQLSSQRPTLAQQQIEQQMNIVQGVQQTQVLQQNMIGQPQISSGFNSQSGLSGLVSGWQTNYQQQQLHGNPATQDFVSNTGISANSWRSTTGIGAVGVQSGNNSTQFNSSLSRNPIGLSGLNANAGSLSGSVANSGGTNMLQQQNLNAHNMNIFARAPGSSFSGLGVESGLGVGIGSQQRPIYNTIGLNSNTNKSGWTNNSIESSGWPATAGQDSLQQSFGVGGNQSSIWPSNNTKLNNYSGPQDQWSSTPSTPPAAVPPTHQQILPVPTNPLLQTHHLQQGNMQQILGHNGPMPGHSMTQSVPLHMGLGMNNNNEKKSRSHWDDDDDDDNSHHHQKNDVVDDGTSIWGNNSASNMDASNSNNPNAGTNWCDNMIMDQDSNKSMINGINSSRGSNSFRPINSASPTTSTVPTQSSHSSNNNDLNSNSSLIMSSSPSGTNAALTSPSNQSNRLQQQQRQLGNNQSNLSMSSQNQLKYMVQQIQLAVQAGHLSAQILNQPLAPMTLHLLYQMLRQIRVLQTTQEEFNQPDPQALDDYSPRQKQLLMQIQKAKQNIVNLQNQIAAQQAIHTKQTSSTNNTNNVNTGLGGGVGLGMGAIGQPIGAGQATNLPPGIGGKKDVGFRTQFGSDRDVGGTHTSSGSDFLSLSRNNSSMPSMDELQNSWRSMQISSNSNTTGIGLTSSSSSGSIFGNAGVNSSSAIANNSNNNKFNPSVNSNKSQQRQSTTSTPWSTVYGDDNSLQTQADHTSSSSFGANSVWPTSIGTGGGGGGGSGLSSLSKTNAFSGGVPVPEFEPGKPWRGSMMKNVEDDPTLTPGSIVRSLMPSSQNQAIGSRNWSSSTNSNNQLQQSKSSSPSSSNNDHFHVNNPWSQNHHQHSNQNDAFTSDNNQQQSQHSLTQNNLDNNNKMLNNGHSNSSDINKQFSAWGSIGSSSASSSATTTTLTNSAIDSMSNKMCRPPPGPPPGLAGGNQQQQTMQQSNGLVGDDDEDHNVAISSSSSNTTNVWGSPASNSNSNNWLLR